MPEIARFFGIIVAMYYDDHDPPHFHARYGSQKARIAIDDLSFLDGRVSPRVRSLIIEWASLHQDELRENWELAREHQPLRRVEPLE